MPLWRLRSRGGLTGRVRVRTWDARTGHLLTDTGFRHANQITNAAAAALATWLTGRQPTQGQNALPPVTQIELGTGTGTAAATDTSLITPVPATLVPVTQAVVLTGPPASPQWTAVWGGPGQSAQAGTFTEAGLFNTPGTLFAHLTGLNVVVGTATVTTLDWVWTLTI